MTDNTTDPVETTPQSRAVVCAINGHQWMVVGSNSDLDVAADEQITRTYRECRHCEKLERVITREPGYSIAQMKQQAQWMNQMAQAQNYSQQPHSNALGGLAGGLGQNVGFGNALGNQQQQYQSMVDSKIMALQRQLIHDQKQAKLDAMKEREPKTLFQKMLADLSGKS